MTFRILPLLLYSSLSFASFESGRYTVFDRYGLPPSPEKTDPLVADYEAFEKNARKGGTLRIASTSPIELIYPGVFQRGLRKQVFPLIDQIYEPLMRPKISGAARTLYPWLAKAVRVDMSTQTYVIELNEKARFSDGSPLHADDVVFSLGFIVDEVLGVAMKPWVDRNYGKAEIKALSPHEVQIRFPDIAAANQRESLYAFLAWHFIVKKNSAENSSLQIAYPVIGTGPYLVESANRDRVIVKRNEDYWNRDVPLNNVDRIDTTVYRDRDVSREAVKRGDLNFFEEFDNQKEAILDAEEAKGRLKKHNVKMVDEQISTVGLFMNTARPHLNDLRFRKAMILMTDVPTANTQFYHGKLSLLNSPGANSKYSPKGAPAPEVRELLENDPLATEALKPFENMGYEELATKFKTKRERQAEAIRLLKEAGYVPSKDGLTKDGQPVELKVVMWRDSRVFKTVSLLEGDLKRIGIKLNYYTPPDEAGLINAMNNQDYDLHPRDAYIAREFENYDADNVLQRYSSEYARAYHPTVNPYNIANLNSKALDEVLKNLISADRSSPSFRIYPEAFLRLISAHLPYILMGERITSAVYADKNICVPPTETRMIESIYFSDKCP